MSILAEINKRKARDQNKHLVHQLYSTRNPIRLFRIAFLADLIADFHIRIFLKLLLSCVSDSFLVRLPFEQSFLEHICMPRFVDSMLSLVVLVFIVLVSCGIVEFAVEEECVLLESIGVLDLDNGTLSRNFFVFFR